MFEKNWKNFEFFFENSHFFEDFFGKTALNRELAQFSVVWKPHYTRDCTKWGIPVHNLEVWQNCFWHKYLPLQNEQVHPITESSKNKSWVAHAGSLCHCECSLEMLMVHGTVWSWREVEAEARGCRGWGPETLRAPWRLALTSVMESCKDWSFKNMTQFLKKKIKIEH